MTIRDLDVISNEESVFQIHLIFHSRAANSKRDNKLKDGEEKVINKEHA